MRFETTTKAFVQTKM